ncbi:MAG: hypothetical protein PF542_06640 [Nanoarchaeota archaeon]|jgi:hypothetical protein|nr:hypothetical protein [Nanoarchaeota archaeon]
MNYKIEKSKHYKLKVNVFGRIEEYEGKVIDTTPHEFRFETEEDNACRALTLKIKNITFAEEFQPKKEQKVYKISTKKKYTNLKAADLPEF